MYHGAAAPLSSIPPPLCGFDELAKRVEVCVQIANPKLVERANNGAVPSASSSSIAAAAQTTKSNVARMMNSNFSGSHGKSKRKSTPSSNTTTGSRRASKQPKCSTTSTVCDPSSAIANTPVPQFNALYAIDAESLAPPHRSIEHYNRLLPSQIVWLSKNASLSFPVMRTLQIRCGYCRRGVGLLKTPDSLFCSGLGGCQGRY